MAIQASKIQSQIATKGTNIFQKALCGGWFPVLLTYYPIDRFLKRTRWQPQVAGNIPPLITNTYFVTFHLLRVVFHHLLLLGGRRILVVACVQGSAAGSGRWLAVLTPGFFMGLLGWLLCRMHGRHGQQWQGLPEIFVLGLRRSVPCPGDGK